MEKSSNAKLIYFAYLQVVKRKKKVLYYASIGYGIKNQDLLFRVIINKT